LSRKYKFKEKEGAYFVSFATVGWVDVFTRQEYFQIFVNALDYCRKQKGMELFAYCIMPSHVHLIFRSKDGNPSGLMMDLKGFTSRNLLRAIKDNPQESRKEWMMDIFQKAGNSKSNVQQMQFWQHDNHPIEIWSIKVFEQKMNYIHENPVESGFVVESIEWKYSSARNYAKDDQSFLEIDVV
jgi:REP element-mobilizing transposase RayT